MMEKFAIIAHTHWDREWYLPYRMFRAQLVAMLDRLLGLMARRPDFPPFMLDGQSILLKDYLAVRPEREGELRRLVSEGRLLVGPFYVHPDELLVGGESLIRNLLQGLALAHRFGLPMMVGYVADTFGHTPYLPAILRGFGIEAAVLMRGPGPAVTTSEFWWEGPEGSRVLALYLAGGYSNALALPQEAKGLRDRLEELRRRLAPFATTSYRLLMSGDDHSWPQEELPEIIAEACRLFPAVHVLPAALPQVVEGIRAEGGERLPVHREEMRWGYRFPVLTGTWTARMGLKLWNWRVETLLSRWAEPLAAWAWLRDCRQVHLVEKAAEAWRILLQNQSHDCIGGCGIDQVAQEMEGRFRQAQQLGEG
ncbi:MAG TPA: hypothetical protein VI877_05060, partial [Dehalococcoidia bacterium]|nr:hypothetical protein [Dehalococcoidia bacterium]